LALNNTLEVQQMVALTYTPSDVEGSNAVLQDTAGNDSASLTNQIVTIKVPDLEKPVVTASQVFNYNENLSENAVLGTVAATDNVRPTGYRFANAGGTPDTTSADGYFTIDNGGKITITAAGAAAELNNFENSLGANGAAKTQFLYAIQATDGSNWSDSVNVTLKVTNVNEAPTLTSVTTLTGFTEDTFKEITYAQLLEASNAKDVDVPDTIRFRIETVSTGTLQKWDDSSSAWVDVEAGTTTLGTGEKLQWKPAANANGSELSAFTIIALDTRGLTSGDPVQVVADVSAVNDAPTGGDHTITLSEDSSTSFTAQDFGFADANDNPSPNSLKAIIIKTVPLAGTLLFDGNEVTADTTISADDLDLLEYIPATNANGTNYASFTFLVQDDTVTDTIKNFISWNAATGAGDKLNISALLDHVTYPTVTGNGFFTSILTGQTVNGVANSTVITLDTNGWATGGPTQVIVLEGINLLTQNGITTNNYDQMVTQLISKGVLIA
jgi:hypothetical protein